MREGNDDGDWTWRADTESVRQLRDLVGHRHVVEALDALSNGPGTVAELVHRVGCGRRGLAAALRTIAAHGLVGTNHPGSWDAPASRDALYALTDRGHTVVATLSRLSVWTLLVEGSDHEDGNSAE
ncbi:hypothetical protein MMAD_44620 [Mycolicibacterium madagascariense]|uniref:Transcriptional regulator n=1 Tax=Mycolicibacterium madagascariense TaxID=212765 RepID=A0A7I7XLS6_9MYCO|nr:hypothetical protein [Mycolicibacterium madagascariense]MCV7012490.1 hypothetical protein [Mycolicibacterium madagascariense]BBZ30167.1 hypothetical protein MMAD_44620 [Mycolicibacterium madagascariense]